MIGAINASNGEKTITKTIPYLNKLDISCDASWVHLSKDGDKLIIKVDANPIATNARGAKLKISNGIKEAQVQICSSTFLHSWVLMSSDELICIKGWKDGLL